MHRKIILFLSNFPLYHLIPNVRGFIFLWTTYSKTDTIGVPPLIWGQQKVRVFSEVNTRQDMDKGHLNTETSILTNREIILPATMLSLSQAAGRDNSPLQKYSTAVTEIEPKINNDVQ